MAAFIPAAAAAPVGARHTAWAGAPTGGRPAGAGRCAGARAVPRRGAVMPPPPAAPRAAGRHGGVWMAAAGAPDESVDALVVGSGVSGSTLAYRLHQRGVSTLLTEARDVVGGNVISRMANGYTWEEGPNTFQPAPHILRLAVDVGLKEELVFADHTLPRFVYWKGKLYALPMGPADIPTFRLLSPWGAVRAGLGAAGFVLPNWSGKEESVKEFITRHLGAEVFTKMIDPFVSGVYAGDPSALAIRGAFGKIYALQNLGITQGIVEGAIIRLRQRKAEAGEPDPELPVVKGGALGSFREGLGMLPKAVAGKLGGAVRLGWTLTELRHAAGGKPGYEAVYATPDGPRTVHAKTVSLTAPAGAAASILGGMLPAARALDEVYYPCVWSVTLSYPTAAFKRPLKGFGNLIPRSMNVRTLGTIWSSSLFPGRAPAGRELLLSYIGGAQDKGIADLSEAEVVAAVDADIKALLLSADAADEPPVVVGVRKWPRAIPQYVRGHLELVAGVREAAAESCPGLFLGGNYASGVAFGDCVAWGDKAATDVVDFLGNMPDREAAVAEEAVSTAAV